MTTKHLVMIRPVEATWADEPRDWTIRPNDTDHPTPAVNLKTAEAYLPTALPCRHCGLDHARTIQLHELGHVRGSTDSPSDKAREYPGTTPDAWNIVEDDRINRALGITTACHAETLAAIKHAPDAATAIVAVLCAGWPLTTAEATPEALAKLNTTAPLHGAKPITRADLRKIPAALAKTTAALIGDNLAARKLLQSIADLRSDPVRLAYRLSGLLAVRPDDAASTLAVRRIDAHDPGVLRAPDPHAAARRAPLPTYEATPKLEPTDPTVLLNASTTPPDDGTEPIHHAMQALITDNISGHLIPFTDVDLTYDEPTAPELGWTREGGSTILRAAETALHGRLALRRRGSHRMRVSIAIDVSGSMSFGPADLQRIVDAAPHAQIALYSGLSNCGYLVHLTSQRRRISSDQLHKARRHMPGGNVVDVPALLWLGAQRGLRLWLCDGIVTGTGDLCYDAIATATDLYTTRFAIVRCPTVLATLAALELAGCR